MAQSPLHQVTDDSAAHSLAYDETRTRRRSTLPGCVRVRITAGEAGTKMDDKERATGPASSAYRGREVLAPPQPMLGRQHVMDLGSGCSGRQAGATLAAAGRENRAAGTGAHPQPEAVGLRATTVVRLEGALAHSGAPEMNRKVAVYRLAVTVRPRVARNTPECTASRSQVITPVILAHRRQAAAAIDNSTSLRYARLRHPVKPVADTLTARFPPQGRGKGTPGDIAWHICTHPVDNDLNRAPRPDYRGWAPIPSRPSREPRIRGTCRRPPPSE